MNETKIRTPLQNLIMTFVHWLVLLAAEAGAFVLADGFSYEDGVRPTGSFLPETVYRVNIPCFIAGILLAAAAYVFAWIFLLRSDFTETLPQSFGWKMGWWLLYLIGHAALFFVDFLVLIYEIGIFSTLEPDACEAALMIFPFTVLLFSLVWAIIMIVQHKRNSVPQ